MGLILLVSITIYRKRRNRGDKSVERREAQEESVTYYNVQIDNSPNPPGRSDSELNMNSPAISTESEEPQPTSDYEGISSQNEMPFREHNYEKISVSNETSAYTSMAFTPDYVNAEGY
ncbi:uncharacterized protein LOC135462077 [Liolophura sinensis]|uniref:uncharacterized protein LOC135462077 n=1 Tax=Liolophura sinensis TaxID=3198878 RepID=UPI0031596F2B